MNAIFPVIFLAAALLCLIRDPALFLPALLEGGQKAAVLSLSLLASYCVWLGFFQVLEESGLERGLGRLMRRPLARLLGTRDEKSLSAAARNLTANLLGLPGASAPAAIEATQRMMQTGNRRAAHLLFVLNCAGLQLLPTTVIALRTAAGAASPADIALPTLLSSLCCAAVGVLIVAPGARKS